MPAKAKNPINPGAKTKDRHPKGKKPAVGEKTVCEPAVSKITKERILANLRKFSDEDRETAKALLASLGIPFPDIED
ncbi:MAG: hypothetical protein ACLQJ7_00320 [Syntrophobacteraceae bacterium]